MKQYERSQLHYERLRKYRDRLDKLLPDKPLNTEKEAADKIHSDKFPRLKRVSLHRWWVALHLLISLVGIAVLVMVFVK
jgi:hypothetical protein